MAAVIRQRGHLRRSERGAELVEFAIVLPILLLLIVGLVDFGLLFRDYEILTNAAREGARLRSLADNYTDLDVQNRVKNYAADAGLTLALVSPTVTPATLVIGTQNASASTVTVTYDHEFTFLAPIATFFGGSFGTVTLTAQSTMRHEQQSSAP